MMKKSLKTLPNSEKKILFSYLTVLIIGVTIGLIYVCFNTNFTTQGTLQHFNGDSSDQNDYEIFEHFPMSIESMLINTHGHIISFAFIFLTVLLIFNYSSFPNNRIKSFLLVEPFVSIITTFGSLWGIRFISEYFIILMFVSSILLYGQFFFMTAWSLKDLMSQSFENKKSKSF